MTRATLLAEVRRFAAPARPRRRRRGSELIEFAMIFPVYLFLFFGIMEYSWYFFQRAAVVEATRLGCQAAGQQNPETDSDGVPGPDFFVIADEVIRAEIGRKAGIRCDEVACDVTVTGMTHPMLFPNRVICEATVPYRSLTGFLGTDEDPGGPGSNLANSFWGTEKGGRMLPRFLRGRASSIFEEAD